MSKPTRIYVVIDTKTPQRYLVRAINPWVATRRVIARRFVTRVASQDELIRLTAAGVGVIEAGQDSAEEVTEDDLFPRPEMEDIESLP